MIPIRSDLLSLTVFSCVFAVLALSMSATPAFASSGADGDLVSLSTKTGSGRREDIYRVPAGAELVIKQVCVEHPAMAVEVGRDNDRVSYNGSGCTRFSPGYVVAGGVPVRCMNRSGQSRACTMMGTLKKRSREGARFFDVDEWLEDRAEDEGVVDPNGDGPR